MVCLVAPIAALQAAQTCDTHAYPLSTATARFDRHDDGTVTDRRSNLMWTRCSAGQTWTEDRCVGDVRSLSFKSASTMVEDINRSGALFFSDWRLPRIAELASIAERECSDPRIDLALFPGTPPEFYWTVTTRPQPADGYVFALSFGPEGIRYVDKEQAAHLRLVRDAR